MLHDGRHDSAGLMTLSYFKETYLSRGVFFFKTMTTKPQWAYKYKRIVTSCVMRRMIAVKIDILVMISIERSETNKKEHWKSETNLSWISSALFLVSDF